MSAAGRPSRGPYRAELRHPLEFEGALHIGSGERLSLDTDLPVLRNADGLPYLPGSSVRGVVRDWCEREAPLLGVGQGDINLLFGVTPRGQEKGDDRQGRLTVHDVCLGSRAREVRDHVTIDESTGAAKRGAKFDREVIVGASGELRLVYEGEGGGDEALRLLRALEEPLEHGVLAFGGRTGTGLGRLSPGRMSKWEVIDRSSIDDLANYLWSRLPGLGAPAVSGLQAQEPSTKPPGKVPRAWSWARIPVRLQFDGPTLVAGPPGSATEPDATFFRSAGEAIIPGSSLRGAIRAHARAIREQVGEAKAGPGFEALFGKVAGKDKDSGIRGLLRVRDCRPVGEVHRVKLDHVAIDRLTGFAASGRLFDALALASPTFDTELLVLWHDRPDHLDALRLLLFAIRDTCEGLLWVGSRTRRGYGWIRSAAPHGDVVVSRVTETGRETVRRAVSGDDPDASRSAGLTDLATWLEVDSIAWSRR